MKSARWFSGCCSKGAVLDAHPLWLVSPTGTPDVRRGVRLLAPSPSESADEAPTRVVDEAGPRVWCRRRGLHSEPNGPGLSSVEQRRAVVHRPFADRRGPRTRTRRL